MITDNYFLMTSVLNRRPQTTCIQVWHANGSLKKFGLEDVTNQNRPASDISRFKKVYRSFDFVTVGSDAMADVFKKSFGIRDGQLLKTGVPLTDVYYEEHKPELKHKWPKKSSCTHRHSGIMICNPFGCHSPKNSSQTR